MNRNRSTWCRSCAIAALLILWRPPIMAPSLLMALGQQQPTVASALYQQENAPSERRVEDLLSRMTEQEKALQLDLYIGATALVDQHSDKTHASSAAKFLPG